jgi:hypothetical protein
VTDQSLERSRLIGSQAISTTELINEAKISVRANQQV